MQQSFFRFRAVLFARRGNNLFFAGGFFLKEKKDKVSDTFLLLFTTCDVLYNRFHSDDS